MNALTVGSVPGNARPRVARFAPTGGRGRRMLCRGAQEMSGVVFQPFSEVQDELALVTSTDSASESFARCGFTPECEAAINEQINVEYNISYLYHAAYAFFDRDNVGLPGFAKYFKQASEEEREHAEKLMSFQNTRGGRVKLMSIMMPEMEFSNDEKGEALYAMELALSLEKLNFQKLRHLHQIADNANDAALCDFIESDLLQDQVQDIKKTAEMVSQLRRIGKGHAVWHFDRELDEAN